jgi:LemA protein
VETAGIVLVIALVAAVVLAAHLILTYNNLVTLKNNVAVAWANIDVLLKQRHDEIPNLVEICRRYMQYEQETLLRVTEARASVSAARKARNIDALGPAEAGLRAGVARVFVLAEAYPDLKASQNFLRLQDRISGLENAISDRREHYNDCVNINNIRIQQVPEAFIAATFGFKEARMLEFEAHEIAEVSVNPLFRQSAGAKAG